MRTVFADSNYWIALLNPNDALHEKAGAVSRRLAPVRLVTSDEVLSEFLAFYGAYGPYMRAEASRLVRSILTDANTQVVPQTRDSFLAGLELYEQRPDKQYSLTDCISMAIMRKQKLTEVLTYDEHFVQEGFQALLRE